MECDNSEVIQLVGDVPCVFFFKLQILTALVKEVSKPVTCKIRILPTVRGQLVLWPTDIIFIL